MKLSGIVGALLAACVSAVAADEDLLDSVDRALSFSTDRDEARARISGTVDLANYWLPAAAPGLIFTDHRQLLIPRLSLFVDAQLGGKLYLFAQVRADRGFDPSSDPSQVRMDEVALRFTPWADGRLNLQVGRFATVVGNWVERHGIWADPFITAPLPYENLTGIWDSVAAGSAGTLQFWSHLHPVPYVNPGYEDKYRRLPIIWGPSYANGASVSGVLGRVDYAVEVKGAALSSRPEAWGAAPWHHPTFSARLGYRPNLMWNFGVSASTGTYLRPLAGPTLAPGERLDDYRQTVFGQDAGFAWHRLQVWAELYEARFAVPRVGGADTIAGYWEVEYQFGPQWFGAVRWNRQVFRSLPGGAGPWSPDVSRLDVGPEVRFTAHTELKLQYSLQREDYQPRQLTELVALQFVLRF